MWTPRSPYILAFMSKTLIKKCKQLKYFLTCSPLLGISCFFPVDLEHQNKKHPLLSSLDLWRVLHHDQLGKTRLCGGPGSAVPWTSAAIAKAGKGSPWVCQMQIWSLLLLFILSYKNSFFSVCAVFIIWESKVQMHVYAMLSFVRNCGGLSLEAL